MKTIQVILLSLLIISLSSIYTSNAQTFGSRCAPREQAWVDGTDTWDDNAADWSPSHIPENWNFVRLNTADVANNQPFNVTITDDQWVSSLDIGVNVRLDILPHAFLLLADYELSCWERLWCTNHGVCISLNECQCDAGWTGENCDIPISTCPNPSDVRDDCGICGGEGTFCTCSDYIESPVDEVARLLFLYNDQQILNSIDEIVEVLEYIKLIATFYDPNTQVLASDLKLWISYFQLFCVNCLENFYSANWEFLSTLQSVTPSADVCA